MFYLYHHNDLVQLAELFSELRARQPLSPLTVETVLAPNHGIGRWLAIQLAESEGVAANLETALPGRWIWQLLHTILPEASNGDHFESDRLPWHLYTALPAMATDIPAVADYLGTPIDEVRRVQLARQLADVFDQYLVYRADMLARWEAGETPADNPARWQADVWRWLTRPEHLGHSHRARLLTDFVRRLAHEPELQSRVREDCPTRLYCFGLVALPPDHLRLLYALAEHIDVHFLLPNPSAAYWGDITAGRPPLDLPTAKEGADESERPGEIEIENGHPLLGALGRMARDTLRVLYSDEFAAMIEPELGQIMDYTVPARDTLLHRIQADIVELDCSDSPQGVADNDTSFEVHACHSALREIQVLQDQLLDRLAADDQRVAAGEISRDERLAPRDIIVMLPDVATYAPAIEAVFGGAPADRYLPFGLADRARSAAHPIVTTVSTLLDLPLSRWEASNVLDLLAVPAVMRCFDLSAGELDTITDWVHESGVRWGRDADHRAELGAGAFAQNTWQFGLDRLLLGVAQSDDETLTDGVAPWADLEGSATQALGKLWRFQTTLARIADSLAEPATPGEWQTRLNSLVDELIAPAHDAPDEQRAVDSLRTIFAAFDAAENCTRDVPLADDRRLSWTAVRDTMRAQLGSSSERQPFLAGGITFCGMVPLRAVPFRMVCMLGLNDAAFPRQETGRGFNVMFGAPRLGDRNTRDDDRLLFLQALTAARDGVYISYIGQDLRTGEDLPPSPVVGELMAFLQSHYFCDWSYQAFERRLIHRQPMQPFSARYFSPEETDPRVFTYADAWRDASAAARASRHSGQPWLDNTRLTPEEPIQAVDLDSLMRFFDDPPKAFFEGRLGLKLERDVAEIDGNEPITLDPLAQSILRRRLFDRAVANDASAIATEPDALELARGQLPPPPRAAGAFAGEAKIVNALLPVRNAWWPTDDAPETVTIDIDIAGVRLTGRIADVGATHLRRITPGRLRTKYCLRQWIVVLALAAAGYERTLSLAGLSPKKDDGRVVAFEAQCSPDAASARLADLIKYYVEGQQAPVYFHPDMADDYNPDGDNPFENLWKRYSGSQSFQTSHLVDDAYFRLLLGDDDAPLGAEDDNPFIAALDTIGQPMHEALTAIDPPADPAANAAESSI